MRTRKNCLVIPALALATFNLARSGRSNSRHLVRAFLRSFLVSKCVTFFTVLFRRCTAFTPERLPRLPRASAFLCRSNSYLAHNEFPKITILAISIRLSLAPCRDPPCNSIVLKKFDMPQLGTTSCLSKNPLSRVALSCAACLKSHGPRKLTPGHTKKPNAKGAHRNTIPQDG